MLDVIEKTPTRQVDKVGNEALDLLKDVTRHGLIDPSEADQSEMQFRVGSLTTDDLKARVSGLLRASPAAGMALDAIAPAFAPGDVIELRALNPAGGGAASLCGRLDNPADRAALEGFIGRHNGRWNLYVGINPRRPDMAGTNKKASEQDVVARRVVVLDLDRKNAPDVDPDWSRTVDALRANRDPLLVVDSGNGVHVWLPVEAVSGPDVKASAVPLAAAMARLGADNMSDAPRIIRLPWTVNVPNATKRAQGAVARLAAPLPGFKPTPQVLRSHPLSAASLSAALESIAIKLGLPGKGNAPSAVSPSRVASDGGEKTPRPAPSADVLRLAMVELPNHPGGRFDAREAWVDMAIAIKGASIAGGIEAEGREAFVQWSLQWGGDPYEPGRVWDSITNPHKGWGPIMRALEALNPAGADRVKHAAAQAAFAHAAATNHAAIVGNGLAPFEGFDPKAYSPRPFLYGTSVIAGFITVLAAPGGQGKTSVLIADILAMCSGKNLIGEAPVRPLVVQYHSTEDDAAEAGRRIAGAMKHHGITATDLGGRLFVTSGRGKAARRIKLARMGAKGPEEVPGAVDAVVDLATAGKVDVIAFDPLAAMHDLPENDNAAMNFLLDLLRQVADRTGAAIILTHHTSKAAAQDMDAAGAGAVRGASAVVDGSRVTRTLVRMTPKEAARFGVSEEQRRAFLRIEDAKVNLSPAGSARWVRVVGVPLGNGAGYWPKGDYVGVAEAWTPPTALSGTATDLARVQAALMASPRPLRADQRSPEWVGWKVAEVMGLDTGGASMPKEDRTPAQNAALARSRALVAGWVQNGGLVVREEKDPDTRKSFRFIYAGTPAILIDDPDAAADVKDPAEQGAEKIAE
jgi:hypothetical protein